MRPGALRVGCMVGMFWEAEVRCCVVGKPFHLESRLHLQNSCSTHRGQARMKSRPL